MIAILTYFFAPHNASMSPYDKANSKVVVSLPSITTYNNHPQPLLLTIL